MQLNISMETVFRVLLKWLEVSANFTNLEGCMYICMQ